MPTFTPTLTSDPNAPSYSVGLAETYSWVPQSSPNANRPIFARATYLVNPQDIKVSLSADNINIDLNEINTDLDAVNTTLSTIKVNTSQIPGFSLPSFDSVTPTYHGSTDNFDTISYYKASSLVAQLSFTYVVQPPTVNAERISNIKRTV